MHYKLFQGNMVAFFVLVAALVTPSFSAAQTPLPRSPKGIEGYFFPAQGTTRNVVNNQVGILTAVIWSGTDVESDSVWMGYRIRRSIDGISTSRLQVVGQWKARDTVVEYCASIQAPCDFQSFVFTGTGIFFKGFRNNLLPNGTYAIDYPPGNPVDEDSTARLFIDLAPSPGFRHEYAVTSIDTIRTINADFVESPVDSTELTYIVPSTPPTSNLEQVAVVPNPYKGSAEWDPAPNQRRIHFINLPAGSTVRIFTAGGELLRTLTQNPASAPGGVTGELEWDLKNDAGNTVVSGIYLYAVQPPDGRTPKKGHFVIIK